MRKIVTILQRFGCDEVGGQRSAAVAGRQTFTASRHDVRCSRPQVVLEAEASNRSALKLYENLGFVRDKRLQNYYLNNSDAFRLKLWLR